MPETRSKNPDATQLLSAARLAADQAAEFLRRQEGRMRPDEWSAKGKADFVTEVDRESERMIAAALTSAVPGSVVLGEELSPNVALTPSPGPPVPQSPVFWIVDPLDGTTNFLHRFPVYAVSIAAFQGSELVAGLVHHVSAGIRYEATRGGGATQNGAGIRVSTLAEPGLALIGTGLPFKDMSIWPSYGAQLRAVTAGTAGVRRPGSAALDLCDVAAGRTDGFWEARLAPWDVAAGALIIREAGGIVTDLAGNTDVLRHSPVVAGNPALHRWLLTTLTHATREGTTPS